MSMYWLRYHVKVIVIIWKSAKGARVYVKRFLLNYARHHLIMPIIVARGIGNFLIDTYQ